jgi:hypothetical protein
MKIRWTRDSVRLRITPTEFAVLQSGKNILESVGPPGGAGWRAAIVPSAGDTSLDFEAGGLHLALGTEDCRRLAEPDREGVYFQSNEDGGLRFFIEKDFPCAHPRAADALEPPTETFTPPPGFEERKSG